MGLTSLCYIALHGGRGYDTPELRIKHQPLFRHLVESGWNVLAYEAHALAVDSAGDEEVARLRGALAFANGHRDLRYCRVALLAQGTDTS